MPSPRFVDANILLRYFTNDDPQKAGYARYLLERVERREEKVATSALVVFETVFTLQRTYKVPKAQVREMLTDVLTLAGMLLPGKSLCLRALDLYVEKNVSFTDAYNAVYMHSRTIAEIYSWDADFDKLPGVTRVIPDAGTAS